MSATHRYHSLDALRAAMMLLGLVLHSAASYIHTPLGWAWPYRDPQTNVAFDLLIFSIHLFRMPVFFVAAGFFAALLYHRDGAAGFARNRVKRVLLPLMIFWAVMIPLVGFGFIFAARQVGGPMPWEFVTHVPFLHQPILGHLWFLYDLLLLYVAAIAAVPLARRAPAGLRRRAAGAFRSLATEPWGVVALAAVTTLTLAPMESPGLDTSAAILPPPRILVAYGVFFAFGWLLFRQRELLPSLGARWKPPMAAGAAASVLYLLMLIARPIADPVRWHLATVALAGLATWLLVFGIVGAFVRYMEKPRPLVRYFSDASYWMYLLHLAPIVWCAGLLAQVPAAAFVKFVVVLGVTTAATAITYHYFVRSTAIGQLLNGRRYPRSLPLPEPVHDRAAV